VTGVDSDNGGGPRPPAVTASSATGVSSARTGLYTDTANRIVQTPRNEMRI
jgi:hypothetical protein